MNISWIFLVVVLIISQVGCGGSKVRWYKPGHTQVDYDIDCVECERIAQSHARGRSVTGNSLNVDVYAKAFDRCMFSKGWTTSPPQSATATSDTPKEAAASRPEVDDIQVINNVVWGFGHAITLPRGFRILSKKSSVYGPTRSSSLFCQGPGPVFINILFQHSGSLSFEQTRYPVKEPYFSFDRSPKSSPITWDSYCGQINNEWVGGIGAYLTISSQRRIIFSITTPLPPGDDGIPSGLRLSRQQFGAMRHFSDTYVAWIEKVSKQTG